MSGERALSLSVARGRLRRDRRTGMADTPKGGPAPFVKVTEVEGRLYEFEFSNGSCYAIKGGPLNVRLDLADLAPPETISREWPAEGPPGRFRIIVEFTPAGPEAGK